MPTIESIRSAFELNRAGIGENLTTNRCTVVTAQALSNKPDTLDLNYLKDNSKGKRRSIEQIFNDAGLTIVGTDRLAPGKGIREITDSKKSADGFVIHYKPVNPNGIGHIAAIIPVEQIPEIGRVDGITPGDLLYIESDPDLFIGGASNVSGVDVISDKIHPKIPETHEVYIYAIKNLV